MNHRQHKAMRFVKLLWITKEPEGIGFLSNKYIPSRGRDFYACISSRITTVIQVVKYHQINDNWFNEPFAVSLYILLILRHAWLNLWDKHMTTGRINQVAFLGDTTTRTIPDADETRGRDGRGSRSYRARAARDGRSQGRRPPRRHRILHPKARAIARGPVRRESARLEHGRRC